MNTIKDLSRQTLEADDLFPYPLNLLIYSIYEDGNSRL